MKLIGQPFEVSITEEYHWLTDVFVSDNGTEQRVCLLDPPTRNLSLTYNFVTEADASELVRTMFVGQQGFLIPAYHQSVKIAPSLDGAMAVLFDPLRTELRSGATALIYDRRTGARALVTLAVVGASGAALTAPLAGKWLTASICPVWAMLGNDNASLTRANPNTVISTNMALRSLDFVDPFLNPANTAQLTMFNGLPVQERNAAGKSFDMAFNNNSTLIDYGGAVSIRSRWKHTQEIFARNYLCQRAMNLNDWYNWQVFLAYCQGSLNSFYIPTFRPDFTIIGNIVGTTVTFMGLEYAEDFSIYEAFTQFAFFTGKGRHYAKITGVAEINGNSVCRFDPPLPDDPGYQQDQIASLLLRARIADDMVSFSHDPLATIITLNMRTTDQ